MTSTPTTDELLRELRQRVTRIESRIVRIGEHVGAPISNPLADMLIDCAEDGTLLMYPRAMDVSLSGLRAELRKKGMEDKIAEVWFGGHRVATIHPE